MGDDDFESTAEKAEEDSRSVAATRRAREPFIVQAVASAHLSHQSSHIQD
jgi:hypothetical protein